MRRKSSLIVAVLFIFLTAFSVSAAQANVITKNETGRWGSFDYELWRDKGDVTMSMYEDGTFECEWDASTTNNVLFRAGKKFDSSKTHDEIGTFSLEYGADFQPVGNSYLCVYGWAVDPLVEFYIVESWGNWRPPGSSALGSVTIDGGTYDIYETDRVNQPSIQGTQTFKQFWSVRTDKQESGTISISEHFKAWEEQGLVLGNLYEVAFCVEGYKSSGYAHVYSNRFTYGEKTIGVVAEPPVKTEATETEAPAETTQPAETTTFDTTENTAATEASGGSNSGFSSPVIIISVAGVIIVIAVCILALTRKKKKD